MSLTRRSFLKALFSISAAGVLPVAIAKDVEAELSVSNFQTAKPVIATLINDGKWHHIMLIQGKEGSKLYFDRQEVDSIEGLSVVTTEGKIFLETDAGAIIGINLSRNVQSTQFTFATWLKQPESAAELSVSDLSLVAA